MLQHLANNKSGYHSDIETHQWQHLGGQAAQKDAT
jgi:hypothetical protein